MQLPDAMLPDAMWPSLLDDVFFFLKQRVPSEFPCSTISFVREYFGIEYRKHNSC